MTRMSESFDIRFAPDGRSFRASGPTPLFMAAGACGIVLEQPCGALGTCGACRVRVAPGAPPPGREDRDLLSDDEIRNGWRLACRLVVSGPATIEIPPSARSSAGKSFGGDPPFGEDRVPVAGVRPTAQALGLAVDIGSTSLAAALVDLADGRVVAFDSRLNPQVMYGADVISRIHYSMAQPDGLARLTAAVRGGIGDLVDALLAAAARTRDDVVVAACAGNPTMVQAWAGVPVAALGTAPYLAAWSGERQFRALDVGLPVGADTPVYVFPMVRSHVGSDAVAAAIACGLDSRDDPTLLIDLGTNTEVMIAAEGRFVATSAAAGPAFEGATIVHGMRAAPGAIDAVSVTPEGRLVFTTIANSAARGLCGSGLIDVVAELLRAGAISPSGHLRLPAPGEGALPAGLAGRMTSIDRQNAFIIAWGNEAHAGHDVVLTARDVRQLQLVKASILAAATMLCRHLHIAEGDIASILLAGAFGNFVRKASALAIGLVPPIDPERVRFVGNAAGVGARMAVCDQRVRDRARALAARADYIELANDGAYQDLFLQLLAFPGSSGPAGSGRPPEARRP
jgi:uncharacterized 2Fe-2S/4Fe-4S cluster protein (DUF4445 family)